MNHRVDVKHLAGQNFREGYNCAEAIVRAFRDALNFKTKGHTKQRDRYIVSSKRMIDFITGQLLV